MDTMRADSGNPSNPRPARQLLADRAHQGDLDAHGYAIVPLIDRELSETVRELHASISSSDDHGLTVDYMRPDRTSVHRIWREVVPLLAPGFERVIPGYRPVMATFVTKHPGEQSAMFLHEDRTFVDERRTRAVTMWIPLQDVGPGLDNGGLQVVERSHLLDLGLSGSNTPDVIRPYESYFRSLLKPLDVPAGSAVVYDTRTIHASPANLSDTPRVALVVAMAPNDEPLVHVRATGRRTRVVHRVDESFFLDHHPRDAERGLPEQYPVIATVLEENMLTPEDLEGFAGDAPAGPEPVVPSDIEGLDSARGSLAAQYYEEHLRRSPEADLAFDRLVAGPVPASAVLPIEQHVGIVQVADARRGVKEHPDGEPILEPGVEWERATLTSLHPGARLWIPAGEERCIRVIESPTAGAGLAIDGFVASPQPGQRFTVPATTEAIMWNDGPGELIVVATVGREPRFGWMSRVRSGLARWAPHRSRD